MSEPNDNRDETVPASTERHEPHAAGDDSTPPASPNSGNAAPIDGDAWE